MKKKLYSLFTIFLISTLMLTACGQGANSANSKENNKNTANAAVNNKKDTEENKSTDEGSKVDIKLGALKIVKGELDLAAVPANLAAVLYQKTQGKIKVLNINTLGVLYIASKQDIKSLDDLKGKTIITSGKGATPEYALRYVLKQSGIDPDKDLTIDFKSEHTEVVGALAADENAIVMLPEPFLTVAKTKVQGLKTNLSLTDIWDKLPGDSQLVTGVMIGRSDFIDENKDAVNSFLEEYKKSVEYVNKNTEEAAKLSEK